MIEITQLVGELQRMRWLVYRDDVVSIHYTGIVHRGRCIIGVDARWQPVQDRAVGVVFGSLWIGFCYK